MPAAARPDRKAERRDARRAQSREDILDAAERVFGEHGVRGSLRKIAELSGFSSAAIYLFFENKDDLVAAVLRRRGDELVPLLTAAAAADGKPLEKLHRIVDLALEFFTDRPHFQQMLRQITGGLPIIGPKGPDLALNAEERFVEAMTALVDLVRDGQQEGEIRAGDPNVLAYFYMVLVNEFVLLATTGLDAADFSPAEFHDLVDGTLRPTKRRRR